MPGADNHGFCRLMLTKAREDAATAGVEVPKGLKALRSTKRHFFVQSNAKDGRDVKDCCCAYNAKANYILKLIDEHGLQHLRDAVEEMHRD